MVALSRMFIAAIHEDSALRSSLSPKSRPTQKPSNKKVINRHDGHHLSFDYSTSLLQTDLSNIIIYVINAAKILLR